MRKLFTAFLLVAAFFAKADNVLVSYTDLGLEPISGADVFLKAVQTNIYTTNLISRTAKYLETDSGGVCVFTNVVPAVYDLSCKGDPSFNVRIGVTNYGTNLVFASGLIGIPADGNSILGYTRAQAAAAFVLKDGGSYTNARVFGSNVFGSGAWINFGGEPRTNWPTGGGSGTTYTFMPTNLAAGLVVTNGTTVFNGTNLADTLTSAAATAAGLDAVRLHTNTIGSWVNGVTFGLVPDGVTDNAVVMRLLLATSPKVYLPAGNYLLKSGIHVSNQVEVVGYGANLIFDSTGPLTGTTNYMVRANLQGGNVFRGITFIDGRTTTNSAAETLMVSAIGFARVEDCNFINSKGTSLLVSGDIDINNRSNNLMIVGCTFSNYYGAIDASSAAQQLQFCTISHCLGKGGINFGIKFGGANTRILSDVMMTGVPGDGVSVPYTGIGLWYSSASSLQHSTISGQYAHWASNVVENASGSQSTTLAVDGAVFSASENHFNNLNNLRWNGGFIENYSFGTYFTGCSNSAFTGTSFFGPLTGHSNVIGADCYSNYVAMVPNAGAWTNFRDASQLTGTLPLAAVPDEVVLDGDTGLSLGGAWSLSSSRSLTNSLGGVVISGYLGRLHWGNGNTFLFNQDPEVGGDYDSLLYPDGSVMATNNALFGNGAAITNLNASELTGDIANEVLTGASGTNMSLVGPTIVSNVALGAWAITSASNVVTTNLTAQSLIVSNNLGTVGNVHGNTALVAFAYRNVNTVRGYWGANPSGLVGLNSGGTTTNFSIADSSGDIYARGKATADQGHYWSWGAGITNLYLTNGTLDFAATTVAGDRSMLTMNLTNVNVGDFVTLSVPPEIEQSTSAIGSWSCSATNGYVNITFTAIAAAQNPPSGNFRVFVQKVK